MVEPICWWVVTTDVSAVCWVGKMLQHHLLEVLGVTVFANYKGIVDHAAVVTTVPPRCSLWSLAVALLLFDSQNFQGSVWGLQTRLWLVSLTFLRKHCQFLAIYPPEHLSRERRRDRMAFCSAVMQERTDGGCLLQTSFKIHGTNALQSKKVKKFVGQWENKIWSDLAKGICPTKCFPWAAQCSLCSNWTPLAEISSQSLSSSSRNYYPLPDFIRNYSICFVLTSDKEDEEEETPWFYPLSKSGIFFFLFFPPLP